MTAALRIAVAGRFYWHCGSSHALLGLSRAARTLGIDLRVSRLGIVDATVEGKVPTADPDWKADLLVIVCEERFLRPEARHRIEALYPRSRRMLIDPDGRYSPLTDIGIDANHSDAASRAEWTDDFESLSDVILQPCLGRLPAGVTRFVYFGVDAHRVTEARTASDKPYDVVYVGNNWHRWRDMVWLLEGLSKVRERVARIAVFGQWWNGVPADGCEEETWSDPGFLAQRRIEVGPPVPFDAVEATMSRGRVSPILVRPVLNALELVTPRMFETFAADTVPVLPPYFRHAPMLYGEEIAPLWLTDDPADAICRILDDYDEHAALAREVAAKLAREHSYEARLSELLELRN